MVQLTSKMIIIVIITIALYAAFVITSDVSLLIDKFQNFNFVYLLPAFALVLISYFIRALRWDIFLKTLDINISLKKSISLFFAGLGFGITPGKFGEVIKSHLLKKDYNQSYSKTAPIVLVERYYDLVGLLLISVLGIWFLEIEQSVIIISFVIIIAALIISQQKSLVFKILENLDKISFLKKIVKKLFETFDTIHFLLKPKLTSTEPLLTMR